MSESITVSFPKKHKALYRAIKKSKPKKTRTADYGRQLMQKGLDCVCPPKANGQI